MGVETAAPPDGASSRAAGSSGGASPRRRVGPVKTAPRRLFADRAARWGVAGGGLAIIASILGILFFLVYEVAPLFVPAGVEARAASGVPDVASALLVDESCTTAAWLGADGRLRAGRLDAPSEAKEIPLAGFEPTPLAVARARVRGGGFEALAADGRVLAIPVRFAERWEGSTRRVEVVPGAVIAWSFGPDARPQQAFLAALGPDGRALLAAPGIDRRLHLAHRSVTTNEMTDEESEEWTRSEEPCPSDLTSLVASRDLTSVYGGTRRGDLAWWFLGGEGFSSFAQNVPAGASAVTGLALLLGDEALAVGQADGSVSVWFAVRESDSSKALTRIRDFPRHDAAVRFFGASTRDRTFAALDEAGTFGLYHSTSERTLWRGDLGLRDPQSLTLAPKGDAAWVAGGDRTVALSIRNPHPEVSLHALFGKVHYETLDAPSWTWQSTGGSDEFEAKLSLYPLLIGTLKGTLYSLLLAVPLGVLAAMYVSQFMHPNLRRWVKPVVEIMAALPSVVLGFLGGLWLAPHVEERFPGLVLMLLFLPLSIVAAGFASRWLPLGFRARFPAGFEAFAFVGVLVGAMAAAFALGGSFENLAFGGDYRAWLRDVLGIRFDQRNAIVVGIVMGFAVVPIVFSIAEDAFTNVPRSLISGSLALGASRWQTVARVVLPTASPGIFSAVMVGLGRAVGETMIVLMATGNTATLDWSAFEGFRTLSANLAQEIPEAAQGSTLYRTLFLSALLLFAVTFLLNTVAEIVRQRLRRKYANL